MPRPRGSIPTIWALLAFVSGACTLALEVAWLKRFSQVLGGDIPALTAVTAALFLGLAIGNGLATRLTPRVRRPLAGFAAAELAVATTALVTLGALATVEGLL